MPARRRRRRTHRRDQPASRSYTPLQVAPDTAARGVQSRLFGGVLAALVTLCCIVWGLTAPSASMSVTLAFSIGSCSLVAAVALLMSARREEIVHEMAARLNEEASPAVEPLYLEAHHEPRWISPSKEGFDGRLDEPFLVERSHARRPCSTDGSLR